VPNVTCPEERIAAYVAGEMSPEDERLFDEHLLSCEQCWASVKADRFARQALERLRETAPTTLRERVVASVGSAQFEGPSPPWPQPQEAGRARRRLLLAGTGLAATVGLVVGLLVSLEGAPSEPAQVAALVAMAGKGHPATPALQAGEHMVLAGQAMEVKGYRYSGDEVIVATSGQPFPVPPSSQVVTPGARTSPLVWMASHGDVSMYGVNHSQGTASMLVLAAMPMSHLPGVVKQLHLLED
jgi:Putative zinc-finger